MVEMWGGGVLGIGWRGTKEGSSGPVMNLSVRDNAIYTPGIVCESKIH
jgi:hypothetical protein